MQQEPGSALTEKIIGLAIKVHRTLGPGLLESIYNHCLSWELNRHGLKAERETPLPVVYEDLRMDRGYHADIIVNQTVLLELKSVDHILPVHQAQTRTYLKLSGCQIGLLMNFNTPMLKNGIRRFIP